MITGVYTLILNLDIVHYSPHSRCKCGCPNHSDSGSVTNTKV